MQKALETVKRKEDRPRRFDNRDNRGHDNHNFNRKPFVKRDYNDNRFKSADARPAFTARPVETVKPEIVKTEIVKTEIVKTETVKPETVKQEIVKPVKTAKTTTDLSSKTVAELRDLAKAKSIKGFSTMKKADLLDALK
ncbi:MAG: Rho termination factor N-terminal domain-containing protein [Bacilli bacterium]